MTIKKDTNPNMAKIKFGYHAEIILPLTNAIKLMEQLEFAESIDSSNYEQPKLIPYKEEFSIQLISNFTYKDMKVANILNTSKE